MARKQKLQSQGKRLKKLLMGLNPDHHLLIHGTLGVGKSDIVKKIAKERGIPIIELPMVELDKAKKSTKKQVKECLKKLKKRMRGHDFLAEIMDDAFRDHVASLACDYLTDKESTILKDDDLSAGVQIVVDEFIRWLSGKK